MQRLEPADPPSAEAMRASISGESDSGRRKIAAAEQIDRSQRGRAAAKLGSAYGFRSQQRRERASSKRLARQILARGSAAPGEQSAGRGSEDEAEPERGADHAHPLGAILRCGRVGDICLRGRDGRARDARQDARGEQPGEREPRDPKSAYPATEPARPISKIGRRPSRSEALPQSGAQMNCASEKTLIKRPTVAARAPKLST